MAKNITRKMMHKELRNIGSIARLFTRKVSLKRYKSLQKAQITLFKGKNPSRDVMTDKEIYLNDLRVLVYEPVKKVENAIGLLWLHGGGYLNGLPEQESEYFKKYLLATGCVVFAPDYTLSLEKPYPQALNEAYATLKYMVENAEEYGINTDQIFIGGLSAGGGLAAGLSLYARDQGEINIAFQMPLYPMLDDRMITESSKDNDAPIWTSKANRFAWNRYLGDLAGTDDVPIYAAPARAIDYTNLPPTLTFVGGLDLFKDEIINYVEELMKAGIEVQFQVYHGAFHGFEVAAFWKNIAQSANDYTLEGFKYAAENYFKPQPK